MSDEDREVCEAMIAHGGGFVRRLGELAIAADAINLNVIKVAFAAYWQQYVAIARGLNWDKLVDALNAELSG